MPDLSTRWERYTRRVKTRHPLPGNASLHVVVPVALVVIAVLLIVGLARPVARERLPASALVPTGAMGRLVTLEARQRALLRKPPAARGPSTRLRQAQQRAAGQDTRRLLAHEKLEDCQPGTQEYVCTGRQLKDLVVPVTYVIGLVIAVLGLLIWMMGAYEESWIVPRWSPRLWFTPVYAIVVALMTCGPLLMAVVYYHRADAGHPLPAVRPFMPSVVLYLLVVLQITALVVAFIRSRPPTAAIVLWGRGPFLAVGAMVVTLTFASFAFTPLVIGLLAVFAAAGFVWIPLRTYRSGDAPRRGLAHRPPPVLRLSAVLLPAWVVFAIDAIARPGGIAGDVLTTVCVGLCAVHVALSQPLELDLGVHAPDVTP